MSRDTYLFCINANIQQYRVLENYIKQFDIEASQCILVIKYSKKTNTVHLMLNDKRISHEIWKSVIYEHYTWSNHWYTKLRRDQRFFKVIWSLYQKHKPKLVILGNYGNPAYLTLANKVQKKSEVIFIDEGASSLTYIKLRELYFTHFWQAHIFKDTLHRIRHRLFGMQIFHYQGAKFYSYFPFTDIKHTELISYEAPQEDKVKQGVYVISQPFYKFNFLTLEEYLNVLNKIKNKWQDQNLILVPHPSDDHVLFRKNIETLGYTWLEKDSSIEEYLAEHATIPETVIGFTSTAIFSLMKQYPTINIYSVYPQALRVNFALRQMYDTIAQEIRIEKITL